MLRQRRRVILLATAVGLPALLGLTSCGGTDRLSSPAEAPAAVERGASGVASGEAPAAADSAQAAVAAAPQAPNGGQAKPAARSAAGKGAAGTPAALADVQLIRTANVVVQVEHLDTSSARVRTAAQSVGGTVSSEVTAYPDAPTPIDSTSGPASSSGTTAADDTPSRIRTTQPGESVIVLRVPVASLDQAIAQVTAVGTVLNRTSTSQDVTADLADVGSRVKTQQASVERVRQLLTRASSMEDIVMLESELTNRQSELEALQARQASLSGRAALSTLTVILRTPQVSADTEPTGFEAGLKRGWEAVISGTVAVLTMVGLCCRLIPFAALIGWAVRWWLRRRSQARRSQAQRSQAQGPQAQGPQAHFTGDPWMHPAPSAPAGPVPAGPVPGGPVPGAPAGPEDTVAP